MIWQQLLDSGQVFNQDLLMMMILWQWLVWSLGGVADMGLATSTLHGDNNNDQSVVSVLSVITMKIRVLSR